MDLKQYFENTEGLGVLATADAEGKVTAAIYARPHILEDGHLAFIMRDRLSHHNLQSNDQATYLFVEKGAGYKGKRLYMKKLREEKDSDLLQQLKRRCTREGDQESKFLVLFTLQQELPLIGDGT